MKIHQEIKILEQFSKNATPKGFSWLRTRFKELNFSKIWKNENEKFEVSFKDRDFK